MLRLQLFYITYSSNDKDYQSIVIFRTLHYSRERLLFQHEFYINLFVIYVKFLRLRLGVVAIFDLHSGSISKYSGYCDLRIRVQLLKIQV